MNLYVWKGCFTDYSSGLAVVLAHNETEARDLLRKEIGYDHTDLGQKPAKFKVDSKRGVAFYVNGGG